MVKVLLARASCRQSSLYKFSDTPFGLGLASLTTASDPHETNV
jgi:hypothetical protein